MEENDIVKILSTENEEYRKLGEEHKTLEQLLEEFNGRIYLTPDEEMERKRIQKLKLLKKDRMAAIIRDFKARGNYN
ncbi:MAG: DUF465 domain-containing protein [Nitrospirota bacterium]|jgi:uncharacterized protein YdcH (DUF465 family)